MTPARRQRVVDQLCEAYAQDQFGIQELERRLDDANRVRFEAELRALVSDLGPLEPARLAAHAAGSELRRPEGDLAQGAAPVPSVPNRQLSVGFWSGRVRRGSWVPARRITALALQGGVELDFREAVFGSTLVEVHAVAVMGGIDIIVPPNLRVETSGFAIMGGLDDRSEFDPQQHSDGPVLKIRGFACMGGIHIDVRLPGETAREARSRRRKERRAKRR